jgi:glutamate-1-semialdehyde 2,1-aminomutase
VKAAASPRRLDRSQALRERARELIPAGAHTYSKGDDQFPANAPSFIERGVGARVWDVDGNEYLDWGMGLRAVLLGHAYPSVVEAAARELGRGQNFVRPSPLEVALAERLVELIPSAEMVKLAKNGSDVTTAAVKLARAATGRDVIAVCRDHPFFSVDDWFIGTTPADSGVPRAVADLTVTFRYNDLASLEQVFADHPDRIAAVILEPMSFTEPAPGFLAGVRDACSRHGTVLIFDEMITGFRFDLHGGQGLFGVTPDLATFGKALGNGFAVSALVGRRDIMELGGLEHAGPRVFLLSTTHGGETHAIAAAIAALREYEERDVAAHVRAVGADLMAGFGSILGELGLAGQVRVLGAPCSPTLLFLDREGKPDAELRTLFMQEMVDDGVLIPYIAPSASHGASEVERTLEAARRAFAVVRDGLEGGVGGLLRGPAVKPVFRRYN